MLQGGLLSDNQGISGLCIEIDLPVPLLKSCPLTGFLIEESSALWTLLL